MDSENLILSRERAALDDDESCKWLLRKHLKPGVQRIDRHKGRRAYYDEAAQRLVLYGSSEGLFSCYTAEEVTAEQARDISALFMVADRCDDKVFLDSVQAVIPSTPPQIWN